MPYEIRNLCVYKLGDEKPIACHDTIEQAQAHLAALEANVEDAKMIKSYRHTGDAIKALGDNRIGGYLVRFTDASNPDLQGEFFTKETDFWFERGYPVKGSRTLFEHGLDDFVKVMPIGLIDLMREDDIGLYVEARLNDRADYERMLKDMRNRKALNLSDSEIGHKAELAVKAINAIVDTGKIGWSSGALPQSVIVENKHIKSWAIIEGSLTFTPAEPNGTEIAPIKSALEQLQDFLSIPPAPPAKEDTSPIEREAETVAKSSTTPINSKQGIKNMDAIAFLNQLVTMLQEFLAGAGAAPEEAMAMANEVVDELKAETPVDEQAKAMDEELVKAKMASAIAKAETKLAKRATLMQTAKSESQKALEAWKAKQPINPDTPQGLPKFVGNQTPRVSVSENLKYAHLTPLEAAMVWKMSVAASGLGIRGFEGRKATDFVSEEFYKTAMHKMISLTDRAQLSRPHEDLEVKSMMPFKANELNASDITGQGLEWLGYAYDSQVWEAARNNYVYKTMMERGMLEKPVAQGEKGVYVPIESDDLVVNGGTEANSVDSTGRPETVYRIQPQTTSTVLVQPGTFRTATAYTFTLQEDSFVDMAQEANRKIRIALEENIEKAFINADSTTTANTNINLIDGTPTANGLSRDYYLEFDGLRKSPLVTSTTQSTPGTTLSFDNYANTWALLGSTIAPRKDKIFFLIDFSTFQASIKLLPRLTKDVAGEEAALFTGEMNSLWGIPVLMSGFLALSNTAGKISATAGNNTKGQILAVYAPYWAFVFKRNITIEMERIPNSESFAFYGSMRFALKRRSALAASITYGLTV